MLIVLSLIRIVRCYNFGTRKWLALYKLPVSRALCFLLFDVYVLVPVSCNNKRNEMK